MTHFTMNEDDENDILPELIRWQPESQAAWYCRLQKNVSTAKWKRDIEVGTNESYFDAVMATHWNQSVRDNIFNDESE